jgi:N-acylglucosamine-6-phosphate 2-epimerase
MLDRGIIVSCQPAPGIIDADPDTFVDMAMAAEQGGAVAIRTTGLEYIDAMIKAVDIEIPIIGATKGVDMHQPYITHNMADAVNLAELGAKYIATDCTNRQGRYDTVDTIVKCMRSDYKDVELIADISTWEDGVAAYLFKFDYIATTMVGYTEATNYLPADCFDYALLCKLVETCDIPIIAEGHIRTPADAKRCFDYGAHAVVVGAAITNVQGITEWFVEKV